MNRTIYDAIWAQADRQPDAAALLAPDQPPISYAGLLRHIETIVQDLNAAGIRRDDRVAVLLPNGPQMAMAFLGVSSAATSAPLNPAHRDHEVKAYFSDLNPRALLTQAGLPSPAREAARELGIPVLDLRLDWTIETGGPAIATPQAAAARFAQPDDVALVLPTSGTTSRPKLVPLTQRSIRASAENTARSLDLGERDRCLNVMPLFHIHGLIGAVCSTLVSGGSVVCAPGFQGERFLQWLDEFRPTWYTAVPTIHQAVTAQIQAAGGFIPNSPLRFARSCSAPLPPQVAASLEDALGVPVVEAYGMTEASHQVASNPLPPGNRKLGSVGIPTGPEIAIMDGDGKLLATGEAGEIAIRGATVTSGYDNNPAANQAAFHNGWFGTGDLGVFDADGYLSIIGRSKEIINRGGEKIAPREIEEVLLDHPDVAQAVAFSVPHPTLGEDIAAAVVLRRRGETTERELRQSVLARLSDYKVPRQIVLVDEIPKGPTGKVQRMGLAEALKAELGLEFAPPQGTTEEEIARIWAEELGLSQVGRLDNFFALGGDSLGAVSVLLSAEKLSGRSLPLDTLFLAPTVKELAGMIESGRAPARPFLLPLQTGGDRPPLFCVPGHGGNAFIFSGLARHLGPEQPAYTFRFPDPAAEDDDVANAMLARLAALFVREMRSFQPHGPYLLLGHCFGGRVAFEMAQQLDSEGEQVSLLALVEAYRRGATHPPLRRLVQYHAERLATLPLRKRVDYVAVRGGRRLENGARALLDRLPLLPSYRQGGARGAPEPYPGRVALIRAEYHEMCRSAGCRCDPLMGWNGMARELSLHRVPGSKVTAYKEPHVRALAETLSLCIDEVTPRLSRTA